MTQSIFDQAVAFHSQGRVDDAMALYQQIVEAEPNHAGAIHLLGVGLSQKGQFKLAAQFIQNAIVLNAAIPEFHLNLGNALMGMEEWEAAEYAYGRATALRAQMPEAWFGLGNARARQNRTEEAISAHQQALNLRPDFAEALLNMGQLLLSVQRLDPAVTALARAGNLRPLDPQPRYMMGQALEIAGYPDEAATLYSSLVELAQCPVSLLFDAGNRLAAMRHHEPAVECYKCAVQRASGEVELWNNMANSLRALDRLDDARNAYAQALALAPDAPAILSNLGTVLKDLGHLPDAVGMLRHAVATGGGVPALSNLGHALYLQGNLAEAEQCFVQALALSPNDPDAAFHLGVVELLTGQWAAGWEHYEARWNLSRHHETRRHESSPLWQGEDLAGKTILLWSEQGLGDTLHFIRLAQQVKAKGAVVVVECQPALVPLLKTMPVLDQVIAVGRPLPHFDVQAPLLSLPYILGLTLENLPHAAAYLAPPQDRRQAWEGWQPTSQIKVGLVWSGESGRQDVECLLIDRRRSLALKALAPVLAVPKIQFVSLQLGPARVQVNRFPQVFDPTDRLNDFADTAALIEHLDLIISVDTSVAHLAAAMGKPVWLLSRFDGCWRWLKGRTDTPWYPSMKIFGQKVAQDWQEPVAALAQELVQWVETR